MFYISNNTSIQFVAYWSKLVYALQTILQQSEALWNVSWKDLHDMWNLRFNYIVLGKCDHNFSSIQSQSSSTSFCCLIWTSLKSDADVWASISLISIIIATVFLLFQLNMSIEFVCTVCLRYCQKSFIRSYNEPTWCTVFHFHSLPSLYMFRAHF
jgi:hypothetical protein